MRHAVTVTAVSALLLGMSSWLVAGSATAETSALKTASLRASDAVERRTAHLPRLLSRHDAALYRRIFALQKDGHWNEADAFIKWIRDPLLMGHVRFQRLMHPTLYRSSYGELWTWMNAYADHPGARRVYRLAKKRQPEGWKSPKKPARAVLVSELKSDPVPVTLRSANGRRQKGAEAEVRSRAHRPVIRQVHGKIRKLVSGGYVTRLSVFWSSRTMSVSWMR